MIRKNLILDIVFQTTVHALQVKNFYSRKNSYALCRSYNSSTERSCVQSFVRLGHHDG